MRRCWGQGIIKLDPLFFSTWLWGSKRSVLSKATQLVICQTQSSLSDVTSALVFWPLCCGKQGHFCLFCLNSGKCLPDSDETTCDVSMYPTRHFSCFPLVGAAGSFYLWRDMRNLGCELLNLQGWVSQERLVEPVLTVQGCPLQKRGVGSKCHFLKSDIHWHLRKINLPPGFAYFLSAVNVVI